MPVTSMVDDDSVIIDWEEPIDNGSPILGYYIYVRHSDDATFSLESDYCDGSDPAIAASTQCTIPVTELFAAPFNLYWGYNINAKIVAYNQVGNSAVSSIGSQAVALTEPDPPRNLQEVEAERTTTSISFSWSDGAENGGAPILDYRISFDQALDTYIVRASEITDKEYTVSGLTASFTYKFKVEARNSFGYSPYSAEIAIICATIPDVPAEPQTTNVNEKVQFTWSEPSNNGLPITSYSVMIQKADGDFAENIDYCNGANAGIISATSCKVPLETLKGTPYNLAFGDPVLIKVSALNLYGASQYSTVGGLALI